VQLSEWMASSTGILNGLITKNQQALENPNWLNTWLDYRRLRNKLSTKGLTVIIHQLETQKITPEQLKDTVKLSAYHQLANEIFATHPTLASFSGMEQMAHRERFQEYDRKIMVLQRELVAYKASRIEEIPAGIANGRVRDYTEMGLIQHHIGQKRPRLSVRHYQ